MLFRSRQIERQREKDRKKETERETERERQTEREKETDRDVIYRVVIDGVSGLCIRLLLLVKSREYK